MGFRKKVKVEQVLLPNFIVTKKTDGGFAIKNKSLDWSMDLSGTSNSGMILNFFLNTNTPEEVDELLTRIYYTSVTMLTDIKLAAIIGDYFEARLNEPLKEAKNEETDIKITKELIEDGKKES